MCPQEDGFSFWKQAVWRYADLARRLSGVRGVGSESPWRAGLDMPFVVGHSEACNPSRTRYLQRKRQVRGQPPGNFYYDLKLLG